MTKKTRLSISLFLLFLSSCRVEGKWQTATLLFFDTVCEINLFCLPSDFTTAKEEVRRVFQDIERDFSPGARAYSSPLVINLYKKSLAVYSKSEGCFDITVGPLSSIWGFHDHSHRVPSPEEIDRALENIGDG